MARESKRILPHKTCVLKASGETVSIAYGQQAENTLDNFLLVRYFHSSASSTKTFPIP